MRYLVSMLALATLSACAGPTEVDYCNKFGVTAGHSEYAACVRYYHTQTSLFRADRNVCELEAERTYPSSLYDRGRTGFIHGGYGRGAAFYGAPHGYYGGSSVVLSPDYHHNALVDQLRNRIIEPCMQARGWASGASWEAGRTNAKPPEVTKLPWLNK